MGEPERPAAPPRSGAAATVVQWALAWAIGWLAPGALLGLIWEGHLGRLPYEFYGLPPGATLTASMGVFAASGLVAGALAGLLALLILRWRDPAPRGGTVLAITVWALIGLAAPALFALLDSDAALAVYDSVGGPLPAPPDAALMVTIPLGGALSLSGVAALQAGPRREALGAGRVLLLAVAGIGASIAGMALSIELFWLL